MLCTFHLYDYARDTFSPKILYLFSVLFFRFLMYVAILYAIQIRSALKHPVISLHAFLFKYETTHFRRNYFCHRTRTMNRHDMDNVFKEEMCFLLFTICDFLEALCMIHFSDFSFSRQIYIQRMVVFNGSTLNTIFISRVIQDF